MSQQRNTLICTIGAALIGSFSVFSTASASENPFGLSQSGNSYLQVAMEEGKCGGDKKATEETSKCGAKKEMETKEGKCGAKKEMEMTEGKCGDKKEMEKKESKCGAKE
jgi:hypothetical protein